MADMIGSRFSAKKVRAAAALNTITIVLFYMIAQLVGAGALIKLLLGIDYWISVLIVGVMMTVYVLFGGMTATSWVQIIKAVLLDDWYDCHCIPCTLKNQFQFHRFV